MNRQHFLGSVMNMESISRTKQVAMLNYNMDPDVHHSGFLKLNQANIESGSYDHPAIIPVNPYKALNPKRES